MNGKLKDVLTGPERDELRNVMRNEPVFAGDTISHQTAKSLSQKGLIERDPCNRWVACWEQIKSGEILPKSGVI
jgi:hypothetical protein